jgi:hypothetical protein
MKDVFFRSPLIYLLAFTAISASFSCSKSVASFHSTEIRSPKEMKFNFEDYDVKSTEAVREKLSQLFPKGSSLNEFQSFMERLGAKCYISDELRAKDGSDSMYCSHLVGKDPFVKSKWIVKAKIADGKNVDDLAVTAGLVGP